MTSPTISEIRRTSWSPRSAACFISSLSFDPVYTQKVRTAFLSVGGANLELLEPSGPDSAIAKYIEKRGEGIHHICLRVDNIEEHLARLKEAGFRLINDAPVPGAHGCRVAFLHPAAGNGVLIELSEKHE